MSGLLLESRSGAQAVGGGGGRRLGGDLVGLRDLLVHKDVFREKLTNFVKLDLVVPIKDAGDVEMGHPVVQQVPAVLLGVGLRCERLLSARYKLDLLRARRFQRFMGRVDVGGEEGEDKPKSRGRQLDEDSGSC